MAYITIKIDDEKVDDFLALCEIHPDEYKVMKVETEPTEKEKLAKENHALRRAWKQG